MLGVVVKLLKMIKPRFPVGIEDTFICIIYKLLYYFSLYNIIINFLFMYILNFLV